MKKFDCTLCFNLNQNELVQIVKESLNVLGFAATVMYVNSEELKADVAYSERMLFSLLDKEFSNIHILNKDYHLKLKRLLKNITFPSVGEDSKVPAD